MASAQEKETIDKGGLMMARKMMLKNWLSKADCRTIKIGCKRGSAFVYCGPINDEFYEVMEKENERQLKKRQNLMEERKKLMRMLSDIECELSQPEDVMERKVMDTYPSTITEGQLIVEIDGTWSGKYWDIEEYEKGKGGAANGNNVTKKG